MALASADLASAASSLRQLHRRLSSAQIRVCGQQPRQLRRILSLFGRLSRLSLLLGLRRHHLSFLVLVTL